MRKAFVWALAAVVVGSCLTLPGYGQTAQDVLNKMIKAQGGRKLLEGIQDSTITGTIELVQMGFSGTATMYRKEPNKMRMDMELMGMVITQAFDGQKAMFTNPQTGATEELPEAQAKEIAREAMGNDSLLNPEKYGIKYALKPNEKLDNKDYIVLEQTMADGHKSKIYLDPANYLTYKVETTGLNQAGVEAKVESFQSDYKDVGGVIIAHAIKTLQDGADFMKMTITKVTFNNKLEDSLFSIGK